MRIPWTARWTNASIFQEINEPSRISRITQKRFLRFFGHIERRDNDNLERLMVGRFQTTWQISKKMDRRNKGTDWYTSGTSEQRSYDQATLVRNSSWNLQMSRCHSSSEKKNTKKMKKVYKQYGTADSILKPKKANL